MTDDEWQRINKHIAEGPDHVYLDTDADGTCVVIKGFGVLHPKAYLDLVEEIDPPGEVTSSVVR